MGYIKHNAVVVTGWNEEHMNQAREKAVELIEKFTEEEGVVPPYGSKLISPIIEVLKLKKGKYFIVIVNQKNQKIYNNMFIKI